VTRGPADAIEGLGGRKDVVVVALAASLIEGTDKGSRALNSILLLSRSRIAVAVAAASTLAGISRASLHALAVALARFVASGADVSAHDTLRNGSLNSSSNDLVDLCTEGLLAADGRAVSRETSKSKRNIVLRNVDGVLLQVAAAGLAKEIRDASARNAKELLHGQLLHISITILARLSGVASELPSIGKEGVKGGDRGILLVHGADPATRPAGSDEGAEGVIHPAGIGRVVSRSRGGDVHVVRDLLLVEHGARVASLDEDNVVLVKVLGAEHGEPVLHILATSETTAVGHGNDVSVAVVIIVEENIILRGGLKSLATARARSHASEDSNEVISGSVLASVILRNTFVNIDVISALDVEIVENLTRERIARRVGNIISHEDNDTFIRNTKLVSNLISVADRSLMPVVTITGRTGNKNNPSVLFVSGGILERESLL